jgi:hypothetical protein
MEASGQHHTSAALLRGKEFLGAYWVGGWVGPRVGLNAVAKRAFHPVAIRNNNGMITLW